MKLVILIVVLFSNELFSQCLSGDCKNGFGKYDFGFAIYEGNFISEKPNGNGTMDYGNGEKFVGNFKDGQEDGDGVLYKNNVPQNVTYVNGKAKVKENQVIIGGNIPQVDGCEKGDCYNGFGILKFDSGNRYEGNFENGVKSGEGKFYFDSGNEFSGNFKDNVFATGTFKYSHEQISFTGNFNTDGTPKSGDYYYQTNDATVTVVDGKITKVVNPVAEKARKLAEEQSKPRPCSACSGAGMNAGAPYVPPARDTYITEYTRGSGADKYVVHRDVSTSSRSQSRAFMPLPTECKLCRGTGQEMPQGIIINSGR